MSIREILSKNVKKLLNMELMKVIHIEINSCLKLD